MHPVLNACPRGSLPVYFSSFRALALCLLLAWIPTAAAIPVGAGRVDITPDYPIRLTGFAARKTESTGAHTRLWARALAIGEGRDAAVLVTVDNCGVCSNVTEEVARRLARRSGVSRSRFAVSSSHTHTGPCATGFAPNIFAQDIPPDQLAVIDRYTSFLTDGIEEAALRALANRRPARLFWNQGQVDFAGNRRTKGGPVDHSVPVLIARDDAGVPFAVLANYACHCTTLGSEFNQTCADWAGFARDGIEAQFPGMTALVSIGCGADSNPSPRGGADFGLALSMNHGNSLAREVGRLLALPGVELPQAPSCRFQRIELPYQPHFTREQWADRSTKPAITGHHARRWLARIDRGESLPRSLPYAVQTWSFGDRLAMVFLAGEVVVDYSLRLKRELDGARLWVTGYANDVPCYIPSRRILNEGGYEAVDSLWYYDRPAQLSPAVEDLIVGTVKRSVPRAFASHP